MSRYIVEGQRSVCAYDLFYLRVLGQVDPELLYGGVLLRGKHIRLVLLGYEHNGAPDRLGYPGDLAYDGAEDFRGVKGSGHGGRDIENRLQVPLILLKLAVELPDPLLRPDPGQKLGLVYGLGYEVVRAAGKRIYNRIFIVFYGDDYNRRPRGDVHLPGLFADAVPVHAGPDKVEKDQVRLPFRKYPEPFLPLKGKPRLIAVLVEDVLEDGLAGKVVVYYKYPVVLTGPFCCISFRCHSPMFRAGRPRVFFPQKS